MQAAWKVGLLVVVFAALFVGVFGFLERALFAPQTRQYFAVFPDAGGLTSGSRVLLAGVQVGEVARVELSGPNEARAVLAIGERVRLPVGTRAVIPSSFIGIGDRQVELIAPAEAREFIAANGVIPGSLRSPIEGILPDSEKTLSELNATLTAMRELLEDQELREGVAGLMASATGTAREFGALAENLDALVRRSQGDLRQALEEGAAAMGELAAISERVAQYVASGKLEGQVDGLVARLDEMLAGGQKLVGEMNALVADPEMRRNLDQIFANTKAMTESGLRIAADTETIARNGVALSERAIEIAGKASALADDAKAMMDRFQGVVDRIPGLARDDNGLGPVEARVDIFRESQPNRWRTDFDAIIPIGRERLHFGLFDAFESNKINAQLGRTHGPVYLRYGVYASQPGIGVDYRLAPSWGLRADLFGLNEPRFDLRARVEFGGGVSGWVGVDRIFERNAPSIGVGIRR
jgi:phospholipid/cholesterol/gamma-HCH transport system substrate-binding protein